MKNQIQAVLSAVKNEIKTIRLSFPRNGRPAGFGDLRLTGGYKMKEVFSYFINDKSAEDSPQRHWGMTTLFNGTAFTLIELLVVVLIIGILAAVAVPQYQKAVEKARATEAMIILRSIADANRRYYMANGEYTWSLANLDIEIPGEDVVVSEMDRKETKYFEYGSRMLNTTNTDGSIAIASRLPRASSYLLVSFAAQPTIYCKGYTTSGVEMCKTLGAKTATQVETLYPISM